MTSTAIAHGAAWPGRHSGSSHIRRLLRGRPNDPAWVRPALLGLLAATSLLYLVGLSGNGWGNEFYAAAVQAGAKSWKAFLFGSVDSSNFITVDKPSIFLWPMELSARVFGLNYWSLLVPQALAGVAAVGVLYATVSRWFGPSAGLLAGAVAALTPVAVLMFRLDNPDALLVLFLTLAAYATTRAVESGSTRWLALAGAFVGLGFLAKMLAAFLVLPGFALAYLWAGPPALGKRLLQLLVAGAALVAAAGWWVALVLLTPAADRPYVGGSSDNNILNLAFGYNGLGRLTGDEGGLGGFATAAGSEIGRQVPSSGGAGPESGAGSMFGGATGITRLFQADMGGQAAWLIPAALLALVVMLAVSRRAPRTDQTRAAALVWGGWLLATGLVFSYMSGIFHPYYTIALAPALGALAGIGSTRLWRVRSSWVAGATLSVGLLITGIWAWVLLDRSPGWFPWLRVVIVVAAAAAAAMILVKCARGPALSRVTELLAVAPAPLALIAALGGPLAYSIDTTATPHTGAVPAAGPVLAGSFGGLASGLFPGGGQLPVGAAGFPGGTEGRQATEAMSGLGAMSSNGSTSAALSKMLESGVSGYQWAAATVSSMSAASLELSSDGVPVMAIGGFTGSDPAPSLSRFEELVSDHKIHYFVGRGADGGTGGFGFSGDVPAEAGRGSEGAKPGLSGSTSDASQITSWVAAHFKSKTVGGSVVYDLSSPESAAASTGE